MPLEFPISRLLNNQQRLVAATGNYMIDVSYFDWQPQQHRIAFDSLRVLGALC